MSDQVKKLYEAGDLIGKTIAEVMPPEPAKLILQAIRKDSETGELQAVEYSYPINDTVGHAMGD